jgi:uncharacterized protein YbaR (Trm112 family)
MRLELSEIIACPSCGPPHVMVAVVAEANGPRVRSGFLGCPACQSRFPIEEGVLRLADPQNSGDAETETEPVREPVEAMDACPVDAEREAILVAAVLGLGEGHGCVLLGPGLAPIAPEVAAIAGRWEVLSLVTASRFAADGPGNLSRVVVNESEPLPVLRGRCAAAATTGDAPGRFDGLSAGAFAAALSPLGRLAVVRPGPQSEEEVRSAGLRIVSVDPRVVLAAREA